MLKTVLKTTSHRLTAAGTTHIATKHKQQWSLAFFLRCRKKKTTQIRQNPGAPTLRCNRAARKPPKKQKTRPTPRAFFRQAASSSPLALVMPKSETNARLCRCSWEERKAREEKKSSKRGCLAARSLTSIAQKNRGKK